ncbi:MAG: FtsQ-type POTRA domain-containing protein [Candidatus Wolfebacteria bacterium]|nr:FtsQ-type POTRA domain-containing protein [Candidatus Wolfebacteria bacterium]MDP2704499.1 FtsQ-type POTRA domain-containing protein [bacterium]
MPNNFAISRTRKRAIRKRVWLYGSGILLVLIVSSLVYLAAYSEVGKVKQITVTGNERVSKEAILKAAIAGARRGNAWTSWLGPDSILFWEFGRENEISKISPKLASAAMEKNLLGRTVRIAVEEREAEGVWCVEEIDCYVFDKEGVIFAGAPNVSGYLLLKIVAEKMPVRLGEKALRNEVWLGNMRETIEEVAEAGIIAGVARIESPEDKEWKIKTAEGTEILFSFDFKPKNLKGILKDFAEKRGLANMRVIDFRVPEKVYVR